MPSPAPTDRHQLVDSLRWKKFPVLDDGHVALVDVMGDDAAVVQAARVSYGDGTRKVSDDRQLRHDLVAPTPLPASRHRKSPCP
jgi:thymidylate synthase (FAD)